MLENNLQIDSSDKVFAKVMRIGTLAGLTVMIAFGLFYIAGINQYIRIAAVAEYWKEPASIFWQRTKDMETPGYWFLSSLGFMDSLSMIGIFLLALVPLFSVIPIIPPSKKTYRIFLSILITEFLFSIVKPFIFG